MGKIYVLALLLGAFGCQQRESVVLVEAANTSSEAAKQAAVKPSVIVILGSSTAEGHGASSYQSAWSGRLATYLAGSKVVNLAKGGYTTFHMMASHTAPLANRPGVDTLRNITAALKHKPTLLILSMTTNDIGNGYSVDEVMANLAQVRRQALAAGVKRVLITTSMPRRLTAMATRAWVEQRTRTLDTYPTDGVNFFDCLTAADNQFKPDLTPDGIHPNDKGHQLLFNEAVQVYNNTKTTTVQRR